MVFCVRVRLDKIQNKHKKSMNQENLNLNNRLTNNEAVPLSYESAKKLGSVALEQIKNEIPKTKDLNEILVEKSYSRAEIDKKERDPITKPLAQYVLATSFLSEIKENNLHEFIDKNDLRLLATQKSDANDVGQSESEKTLSESPLETIFRKTVERQSKSIRPNMPLNFEELKQFKFDLKINYVLDLGEMLKDYLNGKEVANIGQAKSKLGSVFQTAFMNLKSSLNSVGKYNDQFAQSKMRDLENLFNGMRHESAFEEMISEGNASEVDNLFEIEDTDYEDELHGIDMRIASKVLIDENGKYFFPSTIEEFEQAHTIAKLDIDIKASENAVEKALYARRKSNHDGEKGQPLILWSHVYNDDFRLDLSEGRPTLGYSPDEAQLYFRYSDRKDGQLDAMKRLDEVPNLKYHDASGNYLHPDDFDKRYARIKQKLIDHINDGHAKIETA